MNRDGKDALLDAALHLRSLLKLAQGRGLDVCSLLKQVGLGQEQIQDPMGTVPFECTEQVGKAIGAATNDPFVFLHSAAEQTPQDVGLLGYHAMAAPTMRDFIDNANVAFGEVTSMPSCLTHSKL